MSVLIMLMNNDCLYDFNIFFIYLGTKILPYWFILFNPIGDTEIGLQKILFF